MHAGCRYKVSQIRVIGLLAQGWHLARKVVESTGLASVKELRKYARVNRLFYLFARCHPDYSTASSHDDETRLEWLPETLNESQASLASLAAHI